MRNLHVRTLSRLETGLEAVAEAWCRDTDSREVYCINRGRVYRLAEEEPQLVADLRGEGFLPDGSDCVGVCSLPDLQSLLIGLSSGELLQVGLVGLGEVEEVGSVDSGIRHLCLSPDSEMITLVTGDLRLILMTRDYTPLSETPVHQEGFGEGGFVNVGWGKKETQFHGSEGKVSRLQGVEQSGVLDTDDRRVRVSWRGDGEMLAVSYITPGGGGENETRRLRVFDRHGVLYSSSEECAGLEQTLAWRPSGSLIATSVRKPNKHTVAFFEKNGLQHGELSLRTEMVVRELEWNCDSTILLVWGQAGEKQHLLQFWTVDNYHWHLKQSLAFDKVTSPKFDAEDPNQFNLIICAGSTEYFCTITLAFCTDTSLGRGEDDLSLVAVVDGSIVRVTPMKEAVIPPPMSAYEVHVDSQVSSVLFQTPGSGEQTLGGGGLGGVSSNNMAVLSADKLYIFSVSSTSSATAVPGEERVKITGAGGNGYVVQTSRHSLVSTLGTGGLQNLSNFVWVGDEILASQDFPNPAVVILKVRCGELVLTTSLPCSSSVYLISAGTYPVVQLADSTVLLYRDGGLVPKFKFPTLCSRIIPTEHGILGLNTRFKLYLEEREIATNITSMFLHSHFLLATTMDHRLIALPCNDLGRAELRWEEAGSRRVERGSRLITAVPFQSRTILQMPRGNLETIQPRSLTVLLVQNLLDAARFKDAFLLARRQRINLNLLVDHDINLFINSIAEFVKQISADSEHMNIFLAELKEEDVCTTMYAPQYQARKSKKVEIGKVEKVCRVVREELERQDPSPLREKNILAILGTLVTAGNKLEEALDLIKKLREGGREDLCDEGLRYLLYSVDVNVLFNVALGTYDFQLVLMVAERSQKDPKEYLPILNKYKAMPESYMKYSIDKLLKRFESALVHVSRCEDRFDECLQLVEENRLYKQALKLFPPSSHNFKSISGCYAVYLDSKRYYLEASLLYEKACQLDLAVKMADKAGAWERAGNLARVAGWRAEQLNELWREMAGRLEEQNRGMESATIWRDWLKDPEESIAVLSRCRVWGEGIRQCRDEGRLDLLETHLLPALRDRQGVLLATMSSYAQKIQAQADRLEEVRVARAKVAGEDEEVEEDRNLEDADLFSETTSVGGSVAASAKSKSTLATRQSNRSKSSKNRRKQDRRVYSTREGSTHEDLGLIAELHEAISNVSGLVLEVSQVLRGMLELHQEDQELLQLQTETELLLSLCELVKPKIWPGQEPVKERFGPESTVEDIIRGTGTNQPYRSPLELLEPHLRFAPRFSIDPYWKIQIM